MENNKILAQKAALIWSKKDVKIVDEIYAFDCVHHQQRHHENITFSGIETWKKFIQEYLRTYPDYQEVILDQIAEGDRVVSILDCHTAQISWSGVVIDRIEHGKIKETWAWFKRKSN